MVSFVLSDVFEYFVLEIMHKSRYLGPMVYVFAFSYGHGPMNSSFWFWLWCEGVDLYFLVLLAIVAWMVGMVWMCDSLPHLRLVFVYGLAPTFSELANWLDGSPTCLWKNG